MQPLQLEKFKVWEENINQSDYFNKLVDEQAMFSVFPHLVDYELLEQKLDDIPSYARKALLGEDGTLMRMFEKEGKIHNTDKHYVNWTLRTGEGDIRATILDSNINGAQTKLGIRGSVFRIKMDSQWFAPNVPIIIEGMREIPILIKSDPQPHGDGYVYDAVIALDEDFYYLEPSDLKEGTRVLQAGGFIGEAQSDRSPVHFGSGDSFVEFSVPLTRMGFEMEVTDDAHEASKNYRLEAIGANSGVTIAGKKYDQMPDILYNELEMKFMGAVNYMKDLWTTYGRMAGRFGGKFHDRTTGRPLKIGPGWFEFLEASYIFDYPVEGGSFQMIEDFLQSVWINRVAHTDRNIVIKGGTGFLRVWTEWCRVADHYGIIQTEDTNYSMEQGLYPGRQGVGVGRKQYTSVWLEPFGKITVEYAPFFDNDLVEVRKYKGLPIQSYQAIVMDYGYGKGPDSNLYMIKNPSRDNTGYSVGTYSPLGSTLDNPRAASIFHNGNGEKNSYKIIHECEWGILVKDPSYMLWFRPNFG